MASRAAAIPSPQPWHWRNLKLIEERDLVGNAIRSVRTCRHGCASSRRIRSSERCVVWGLIAAVERG
ncbi:hypothetical protein [Mesorhizobium sp. LjRoot246]|uniref:hypothetical protein n=1 Tax=Mesorhizobium sp. LjRoot246 TaxID=3342294 RepID=UPI003ECC7C52